MRELIPRTRLLRVDRPDKPTDDRQHCRRKGHIEPARIQTNANESKLKTMSLGLFQHALALKTVNQSSPRGAKLHSTCRNCVSEVDSARLSVLTFLSLCCTQTPALGVPDATHSIHLPMCLWTLPILQPSLVNPVATS